MIFEDWKKKKKTWKSFFWLLCKQLGLKRSHKNKKAEWNKHEIFCFHYCEWSLILSFSFIIKTMDKYQTSNINNQKPTKMQIKHVFFLNIFFLLSFLVPHFLELYYQISLRWTERSITSTKSGDSQVWWPQTQITLRQTKMKLVFPKDSIFCWMIKTLIRK